MKTSRVLVVIILLALTMFLILPSVSWAEDASAIYKSRCAVCHGLTGSADTPMARKQNIPAFGTERVQKQSPAQIEDFILNGGQEKKSSHAWSHKGLTKDDGTRLAAYVKQLGSKK